MCGVYIYTYILCKELNPTCFLIKMEKYMFSFLLLLWEAAENGKNNKNYRKILPKCVCGYKYHVAPKNGVNLLTNFVKLYGSHRPAISYLIILNKLLTNLLSVRFVYTRRQFTVWSSRTSSSFSAEGRASCPQSQL